jgi:protein Tex
VDVSLRGAASIARRLQDPLAELVKIEPKSIGVGQYQHDVNQSDLTKSLDAVVEDCVNGVGVDLNTASVPLLQRVAGVSGSVAKALVRHRESHGAFKSRADLLSVSGLGAKTFEQCAGFLRIRGGSNPLDATGVHPESYEVVEKLLALVKKPIGDVMGRSEVLKSVKPEQIVTEKAGALTVQDILAELEKPGRDPRGSFVVARFNDGIEDIKDLQPGMILEGTVSNVAAFGAFVDLGVHQDGLIHVSQLSHKFITDAREVVRAGQLVKVKVMEVDVARKRIGLTMKLDAAPPRTSGKRHERGSSDGRDARSNANAYRPRQDEVRNSAMADKLAALRRN